MDRKFELAKADSYGKARTKATDLQWQIVEWAVKAYFAKYPQAFIELERIHKANQTKYQLATKEHKELRKASWRHIADIPADLYAVIEKHIPKILHKDSVNKAEFLRRFPIFRPGEKY